MELNNVIANLRQVTSRLRALRLKLPAPGALMVTPRPAMLVGLMSSLNEKAVVLMNDIFMIISFEFMGDGDDFSVWLWSFKNAKLVFTSSISHKEFFNIFRNIDTPKSAA